MSTPVTQSGNFKNITGTTTITVGSAGAGLRLKGIFVSSSSSGTLRVQDGSTTVVNTFSATAATFYNIPAECATSIVITVGGTLDACVFWD